MKENDIVPGFFEKTTLADLMKLNTRVNMIVSQYYGKDIENEWTSERDITTLYCWVTMDLSIPPEFTTKLDCDDAVFLLMMVLSHDMPRNEYLRRLRPAEITIPETGERHAILKFFITPSRWLVLDSRLSYIGEDGYERDK